MNVLFSSNSFQQLAAAGLETIDPAFHGVLIPAQHLDGEFRHANDHYRVLIEEAAGRPRGDDGGLLRDWAGRLREAKDRPESAHIALEEEPLGVLQRYPDPHLASRLREKNTIPVDREKARDRACRGDGLGAPENRTAIVQFAFGTLFGGIVFSLALAVGLGSKELVTKSLERDSKKVSSDTVEDPLRHL